jgi:hypothetical protein
MSSAVEKSPSRAGGPWGKIAVFALVTGMTIVGYVQLGDALSSRNLARREAELLRFSNSIRCLFMALHC